MATHWGSSPADEHDDFDEFDPTPYGGGYDLFVTFGRPLPPSDETCYPCSAPSTSYDAPHYAAEEPSPYGHHHKAQAAPGFRPQHEQPSYGGGGSGYGGSKPQPAYGFRPQQEEQQHSYGGGGGGYGSDPPRRSEEDTYGSGYGRKPQQEEEGYGSGYGRRPQPEAGYGSGYGSKPQAEEQAYGSEYGSGYGGRKPQAEESYGSGYGGGGGGYGGRKVEDEVEGGEYGSGGYRKPKPYGEETQGSYGYGQSAGYEKPSYGGGDEYGRKKRVSSCL
jgi:hypothetical protein